VTHLAIWRKTKGLTQAEAARAIGIARPRYQDVELGRLSPTPYIWKRLCAYFGDEKAAQLVRHVRSIA
jgi:DNA-binding XRE family transcriptional regulator